MICTASEVAKQNPAAVQTAMYFSFTSRGVSSSSTGGPLPSAHVRASRDGRETESHPNARQKEEIGGHIQVTGFQEF